MTYKEHYHYGKDESQMAREQAHSGMIKLYDPLGRIMET